MKLKDTEKNVKFGKEESVSKAKVSDKNAEQATELFKTRLAPLKLNVLCWPRRAETAPRKRPPTH